MLSSIQIWGEGLLAGITRTVLRAALEAEMSEHRGYDRGERPAEIVGNHCKDTSAEAVSNEVGPVRIEVPQDRQGEFEQRIVPKHVRRVTRFDESIISYVKGLTTGRSARIWLRTIGRSSSAT